MYYCNEISGMPPVMLKSVRALMQHMLGAYVLLGVQALFILVSVPKSSSSMIVSKLHCESGGRAGTDHVPDSACNCWHADADRHCLFHTADLCIFLANRSVAIPEVLTRERLLVDNAGASGVYHVIARHCHHTLRAASIKHARMRVVCKQELC